MEDQLGALGLVLNAIILWTTKNIDAAVAKLKAEGHELREEDIARLSPLKHRNLNLLGRYSFTASVPAAGALRPLRDRTRRNWTRTTTAARTEPAPAPRDSEHRTEHCVGPPGALGAAADHASGSSPVIRASRLWGAWSSIMVV